tara:strand:- start:1370 stop:3274 length:1905 start_codon:yes stop_codon:yes gene_type:complete
MAEKIQVEFELNSKDALKNVERLEKEVKSLQNQVKKSNKETEDQLKDVEKGAKESSEGIKKVSASIGSIAKVTGVVFILQKAFEFISEAVKENQVVMDSLNVAFDTAQIIFNQVADAIFSNSENFDALGRIMSNLLTIALTPIKAAFQVIKGVILGAQLAWEQSFFGDGDETKIAELKSGLAEVGQEFINIGTDVADAAGNIVSDFGEAVGEISNIAAITAEAVSAENIKAASEVAKTNIQLKKSAEIAAAESRGLIEQYDRQAEQQRQIRDEERNSIEDRIKANNELKKVLELQEKQMLANAETVLKAAEAQFELTGKDEDYIALLDARNEKLGVLAQIEGFRSEQKSNDLALDKEQIELINSKIESESKLSIEQKRFNAERIQDELLRLEALKEIDLLESEQETVRLQAIVDNANAGTQAKIDAQIALDEFSEQSRQTNLTRDTEILAAEEALDKQKIADKKAVVDAISQFADAESGIGQALLIIKQGLALKETIMDLKRITFKGVEAIGSAAVSTSQNVAESSKIGFPQNLITIASAIAQGVGIIRSVKKAVSKTKAKAGGASASVPNIPTPTAPASLPPAFNIVGSSGTNQLADAIGNQSQQPIQAFVVASEVTSAQALERNTIEGATIG